MTNKTIRAQQHSNAHKLAQRNFSKPVKPYVEQWNSQSEMDRRRLQIAEGRLKIENGLVA